MAEAPNRAEYVALGSSFAAGIGLGDRAPGSNRLAGRTVNSYPQQLARLTGMPLVDMSSSGAKTTHVLRGGQYFQGPQIDALDAETKLVTFTAGGNDVRYVGDLMLLAARHRPGLAGWLLKRFWKGPLANRDWAGLQDVLLQTFTEIRRRSPKARLIVVTYPAILPPAGTCAVLGLSEAEADIMRPVGEKLAELTRETALRAGAEVVDMASLSAEHHACAAIPWVHGGQKSAGAQFHPSLAGAEATAKAIAHHLGFQQ